MFTELTPVQREFKLIDQRMGFMNGVLEGDRSGLYRKKEPLHSALLRGIEWWMITKSKLIGQENLDLVENKKPLTMALGHTSDTDHGYLEHGLITNGYSVLASRLVFAAGMKMWDRWQTSWGMPGMNTFPTAAPGYFEDAEELLNRGLLPEDQQKVKAYIETMKRLNRDSLRAITPEWQDGKAVVVVYPETTRSRNGLLQRGRKGTGVYFRHGLILPIMLEGPSEIFPPEQNPDFGKILMRKSEMTMMVNEPIDAECLFSSRTRRWLDSKEANVVDLVMSRIALLNPDRVDPKYRSLYESLIENIPEGLILKAA